MKLLISILILTAPFALVAQESTAEQDIKQLIAQYTQAREARDTVLLGQILVEEVDQLVSSGTWRRGKDAAKQGMMRSSSRNPGKRTITVENVRLLTADCAIADARYEIGRADGTTRKMWSTFVVVREDGTWRIAAIRNMLPAR